MIKGSVDYAERYKAIYSTLFGLGIGFFITHAFKYWKQILGPDGIQLTHLNSLYILIQVYLFFNYFRYLFGLRRFAEMTGTDFMPTEKDWIDPTKKSLRVFVVNISKTLTINVGIFQLLIFSVMSMLIIPEINNVGNNKDFFSFFYENHVELMRWFFILDLALLSSDLLAVALYNQLDPEMIAFRIKEKNNEPIEMNSEAKIEDRQMRIWIAANILEISICLLAISLLGEGSDSDLTLCTFLMVLKFFLLIVEMSGIYYFLKRFKFFSFINGIVQMIIGFINGTT